MCRKRLEYVGNGLDMCKMAEIFVKRLKYVGNGLSMWEMT